MATTPNEHVSFASLFSPAEVVCHSDAKTRDAAILEVLRRLAYERGIGNVDAAFQAIREREEEHPTLIGPGIAMPHARLDAIEDMVVGVATSTQGVPFGEGDDKRARLIIVMLVPKTRPGVYLQAVSSLAAICKNPQTAEQIAALETPEEVWRFFERGHMELPEHVCAGDIMESVTAALEENDTLEHAIDLFVRHDCIDVPVVDKENVLIGVVTAYELLRVCLPDYILWMDDLSPILNFEPFAEILRNESMTWLAEIMTLEYATVSVNAPAVEVAKELTRHHVQHAYVLKGKKLVGVVSLQGFLNKVLRE